MIVFLHGSDTYRSSQKLKEIKNQYEKAHQGRARLARLAAKRAARQVRAFDFDCLETGIDDVRSATQTISLFESKKLVVLRNVFEAPDFEQWLWQEKTRFQKSPRQVLVVFEPREVQKKTGRKLFQWLKKYATCQEFLLLSREKLKLWIEREFRRYGFLVSPGAKEELARIGGSDLWRMAQEVRKIAAWKLAPTVPSGLAKGNGTIKERDVALLVTPRAEADIFATIDAAARKNKKQAFGLLYRHLQKGDAPQYLFSMLQYQFRTLLEIRDAIDKTDSRQTIATQLKLHPYVLQKGMRVAEQFSLPELKAAHRKLFQLDWQTKTGRADPAGSLVTFLATL